MLPTVPPERHRPPAAAIAAAVLALVSCALPLLFLMIVVAVNGPDLADVAWVDVVLPVALSCGLVVGAVLLLLGRSWLALVVPAGVLVAFLVAGGVLGGWSGGAFWLLSWGLPAVAVVLAALPGVRGWVADRKGARTG
jgi:hypothetical protein